MLVLFVAMVRHDKKVCFHGKVVMCVAMVMERRGGGVGGREKEEKKKRKRRRRRWMWFTYCYVCYKTSFIHCTMIY